jgi:hypothetical protein
MHDAFCVARAEEAARIEVTANILQLASTRSLGSRIATKRTRDSARPNECGISSANDTK